MRLDHRDNERAKSSSTSGDTGIDACDGPDHLRLRLDLNSSEKPLEKEASAGGGSDSGDGSGDEGGGDPGQGVEAAVGGRDLRHVSDPEPEQEGEELSQAASSGGDSRSSSPGQSETVAVAKLSIRGRRRASLAAKRQARAVRAASGAEGGGGGWGIEGVNSAECSRLALQLWWPLLAGLSGGAGDLRLDCRSAALSTLQDVLQVR